MHYYIAKKEKPQGCFPTLVTMEAALKTTPDTTKAKTSVPLQRVKNLGIFAGLIEGRKVKKRQSTSPPRQASALVPFAGPDLFYLLPLLRCAPAGVDVKALLVHGHARLPLAPLDFGEPGFLLLLPNFQLL